MCIGSRPARLLLAGLISLACVLCAVAARAVDTTPAAPAASPSAQQAAPAAPAPAAPAPAAAPKKTFSVKAEPPAGQAAAAAPASATKPAAKSTAKPAAAKSSAARPAAPPSAVAAPAPALDPGQGYIRPFPGSRQVARSNRNFDEYWMPLGKLAGESQADKVAVLEGRWIHGAYITPAGPSVAEVFRHYEQQIVKAGLQVEYTCKGVECGEGGRKTNGDWWWLSDNRRYLAARLPRPNGDLWVAVHVHAKGPTTAVEHEIDVVEVRPPVIPPPPRNEAEVATLEKELKANGRVVLHQIGFVEGKPGVLPQSEPVVKAIADLLTRDPDLKLSLVVHSDDAGSPKSSLDLTKKRAKEVVSLLTKKYGVRSGRVQPSGVGSLSPVTSNATEEGRAQNRRIELLPQGGSRSGGPSASVRR